MAGLPPHHPHFGLLPLHPPPALHTPTESAPHLLCLPLDVPPEPAQSLTFNKSLREAVILGFL